jgi:DNA-binding response OmpR family regulator
MQSNNSYTILIVEDDTDMGYALIQMLHAADFKTLAAADGEEGLSLALANHPNAILLDLKLPKMNGKTVLSKLREDEWGKHVPVIVLTNEDDTKTIAETLKHSAQEYFIKADTDLSTIVDSLRDLLAKQ